MAKARKPKALKASPLSTQRQEPAAPAGKPTPPPSAIPADAVTAPDRDPHALKVGNRVFAPTSSVLGQRKLDILPDMPDIRDRVYHAPFAFALHPCPHPSEDRV